MKFLMVCLVGLLVSVQASSVSPPIVSGQVRVSDGAPVAGAQVVLFDLADLSRGAVGQVTTDEAGQFVLPLAAGPSSAYGLVVSGAGLVAYVDSDFGVAAEQGPVDLVVEAQPQARMKVGPVAAQPKVWRKEVPRLEGMLGDVNNNGQVDLDDGLLGAMYSIDPSILMPNHGSFALGDVNCNGQVDFTDAALIATYLLNPSDAAIESLSIGQLGGFSLNPVTEVVWGSILGTDLSDPTLAEAIDNVPILVAGVFGIEGRDYLYLGIDREVWDKIDTGHIYRTLTERFPTIPFFIEPSEGVIQHSDDRSEQEESVRIFSSSFDNLDGWARELSFGYGWRIRSFDDHLVPGEEQGNQVAVAHSDDCRSCSLSTTQPLDLSGYKSVTLSLHRWVDAALGAGEFLAIEIGNDGIYKRLDTYTDGGGVWRYETYSLAAEDLTDNVTLRLVARPTAQLFFRSVVKTLAIDNVLLTGIPVPVEQLPNLAVTAVTAPATIESGGTVRVQATIRNDGGTEASARSVRVYRHASSSADPASGAEVAAITTGALAAGASVIRSVSTTVPSVTADTTFYYYVCVDTAGGEIATDDNCAGPAEVRVRAIEEEKEALPNLTASSLSISPNSVESGGSVTVQVTVRNNGTADAGSETIRVYRHRTRTANPTSGGTRLANVAATGTLAAGASVTRTISASTPPVTADTTFYYYVCVDATDGEIVTDGNCTGPAEVRVRAIEEEEKEALPNLTASSLSVSPKNPESGTPVTIQVTIQNNGTAVVWSEIIRVYQHQTPTSDPTSGGTRLNAASTGTLTSGASVTRTISASTPSVTADTRFYYYVCVAAADGEVATGDNCTGPAKVRVLVQKPFVTKDIMGGDKMRVYHGKDRGGVGTITLGGLETTDGIQGFIGSAHVISSGKKIREIIANTRDANIFIADSTENNYLLGMVTRLPQMRTEVVKTKPDREILGADAGFITYPHPKTLGCSVMWSEDDEMFCFDTNHSDEYVERVKPLVVRGEDGDVYTVTGSQQPAKNLTVHSYGSNGGFNKDLKIISSNQTLARASREKPFYNYYKYTAEGTKSVSGDSGSPVYTTPDINGDVNIVGVLIGTLRTNGVNKAVFSSWNDVEEALDLKPISP